MRWRWSSWVPPPLPARHSHSHRDDVLDPVNSCASFSLGHMLAETMLMTGRLDASPFFKVHTGRKSAERMSRAICSLAVIQSNPRVRNFIAELHARVVDPSPGGSAGGPRRRAGQVRPAGSRQVQRRLPPEEVDQLVASYLAGATAIALAGKHSIHRATVLAHLERRNVSRRGHVQTPDLIDRTVALYRSGKSCSPSARSSKSAPRPSARRSLRLA
jgi:hypothetical protein